MPSRSTHVRVMPETRAALDDLVREIADGVRKGRGKRFWGEGRLTRAGLIDELVAREVAHRERSRRSSKSKKVVPPPPATGVVMSGRVMSEHLHDQDKVIGKNLAGEA